MIIVKLAGGLGNQMFQYAFGRRLALSRNDNLYLDPCDLQSYAAAREYKLKYFNISANVFDRVYRINLPTRLLEKIGTKHKGNLYRFIKRTFPNILFDILKEKSLAFDPDNFNIGPKCILQGYWQNEKYYNEIRSTLIKDFSLSKPLSEHNSQIEEEIINNQSIGVHIRRGDYINNEANLSIYASLGPGYYKDAIEIISQKTKSPSLFIFSDDIPWVKENLTFDYPVIYIEGISERQDAEEIYLMSQCKHHVIANSSFSWWGAWLATNSQQIVIAPKNWFIDETMNTQFELPGKWLRI